MAEITFLCNFRRLLSIHWRKWVLILLQLKSFSTGEWSGAGSSHVCVRSGSMLIEHIGMQPGAHGKRGGWSAGPSTKDRSLIH